MNPQTLGGGWTLRHVAGPLPDGLADDLCGARGISATVPGCVHTDLLTAGLIPDPYVDDNESALAWIGRGTWEYRTTLRRSGRGRAAGSRAGRARARRARHAF